MRQKIIAGNWKMNKDINETVELIDGVKSLYSTNLHSVKVIVCPPFPSLNVANELLRGTGIELGAQNMYHENEGAYTGEVSPKMLKAVGCRYVIIGHSERRQYFKETDDFINRKARKALTEGLIPIICVGETLQEREQNITHQVVTTQVEGCLQNIPGENVEKVIIAYEPVWAIGTGKNATPEQAQEVHALIRSLLSKLYSPDVASKVTIQYGGSVKPENAKDLLHQPDIDGALVGGACLKADSFIAIVKAAL
ncbi:MAG: triose-phosphate isomerase [Bacteroidetes bacterium]|nr:triose-phosphate isomerase [Bacteroidota bacterium]